MSIPLNKIRGLGFEEGIQNLADRDAIVAASAEELQQKYNEENVFGGLFLPTWASVVETVQKKIAGGLAEGLSPSEVEENIKEEIPGLSSSYTEMVFRTNVNTAYTEGRIEQAKRFGDFVVGFEFSPVGDESTRPEHEVLRGLRASQDDRIWRFCKTPIDYNCRCMLITVTRPEIFDDDAFDVDGNLRRYHPDLGWDFGEGELLALMRNHHIKGKLPTFVSSRI